ncbi:MAG: PASTA domain-containing protein, partial [Clostridia bacterium]|nr:PASTA domain-containing protein [Clostridia bacterium]
ASVCTNGYLMKPYFVQSIYKSNGELLYANSPAQLNQVVNPSIVSSMQHIMEQVVLKGGGKASEVPGFSVGGKTGTAQKYDNGIVSTGNYIGSYICVSPVEDPEYLVLVIIDEPKTSIYGNIVATPVAGEILRAIYTLNGEIIEDDENSEKKIEVPKLVGLSLTEAGSLLSSLGLYYVTEGDGNIVTYQSVKEGTMVRVGSSIMIKF